MVWRRGTRALGEFCLLFALAGGAMFSLGAGGQTRGGTTTTPQTAGPQVTTVADTVYRADGSGATGSVLVSWPAFATATGASVPAGSKAVTLGAGGALNVALVPNAGSMPIGSYYTVVYHLDGGPATREYWVVPQSTGAVKLQAIRATVLPTSVAMQTVSKTYVDTAIAAAVTGHPLDSSPYVVKTGDTMTGPLELPGDPVAPLQASDKNYVDAQVAALSAGIGQKVSTNPQGTQVVAQPTGTDLEVNRLNGVQYASQYQTGAGNNGISNAAASPDCAGGCAIVAEPTYPTGPTEEQVAAVALPDRTRVEDQRQGAVRETFSNPGNAGTPGDLSARAILVNSTEATSTVAATTGAGNVISNGLSIDSNALAGGSNVFPESTQGTVPYFKTTYSALSLTGTNHTLGQHVLDRQLQNCYGVGDCLMGGRFMVSSGGFRDNADEAAHPYDLQYREDARVFSGVCQSGCTFGSRELFVNAQTGGGTQGEGRYLINTNPSKVLSTGSLIGGSTTGGRLPTAQFAGTNFPVSVQLVTAQAVPTQSNNIEPGTVSVAIVTSGVPAGFASNTAALPATSGVACVSDVQSGDARPLNFETAAYTVQDGSHVQLTLGKPHAAGATLAVGGLCGYGLEQKVDSVGQLKQVFPVVASTSPTSLTYAGGPGAIVGVQQLQSAFANIALPVTGVARSNGTVTVTVAGGMPVDLNGLSVTVSGVTDPSYNGTFKVTTPSRTTLQYAQAGPDSTSSSGTVSLLTGSYTLYPMAEVLSVYNPATRAVDGRLRLAANGIGWAAGDTVEEPHYFQQAVSADVEFVGQTLPRPARPQTAGIQFEGTVGPGLSGWVISNAAAPESYYGNGGTHSVPTAGMQVDGPWRYGMNMEAGEEAAVRVRCNLHGCDRWNSGYDLFQMETSAGLDSMRFQPQTSSLFINLRGTPYIFNPQGFTANTINVQTLNASVLHGVLQGSVTPASLPLFGGSGASHGQGAVPDPGANAGTSRFLREDGTWATVSGGASSGSGSTATVSSNAVAVPARADLTAEYLMNEGTGTVVHDTSGQGRDAALGGANGGPAWEGTTDLNFAQTGEYVQLPASVGGAQTWQIAFYNPPYGAGVAPQAPGYGDATQFGANPSLLCGTAPGQLCLTAGSPGTSMTFKANTDGTQAAEAMPVGWHVFTLLCGSNVNGTVVPTRYLYDGNEVGGYASAGNGTTCPTAAAGGNYLLGGSGLGNGTWFVGKVAAAWAWNRPLSLNEGTAAARAALSYMASKGVPAQFRAKATDQPAVLVGLDERSAANGWPSKMTLTGGNYAVASLAAKQTAYDACVQFDLTLGQQIAARRGNAIVVLWGGMNDLLDYGQTPRQVADSLHCLVRKTKQAGAQAIVATETSFTAGGGSAAGDASRTALNAILRAEAFRWGADNLVDLATEAHVGRDGGYADGSCFSDGRHLTDACQTYVAQLMGNAVNELLGTTESLPSATDASNYAQQAGDRFMRVVGNGQKITLPNCTGYALPRQVSNVGDQPIAVYVDSGPLPMTGSTQVLPSRHGRYVPSPLDGGNGSCRWVRVQ